MKQNFGIIAALVALFASVASLQAQPDIRGIGVGLMLGEPTGVTLKGALTGNNAWDATVGTSWFGNLTLQAHYLWNINAFNSSNAGLYFGVGGVIGIGHGKGVYIKNDKHQEDDNATALGAQGVAGFNTIPFRTPVEFFVELDPVVRIAPSAGFNFMAAIGARYYL